MLFFLWLPFAPRTPPAPQLQSSKSQFSSISVSGSSLLVLSPFLLQDSPHAATYPFVQGLHTFQYLSHGRSSSGEPTLTLGYLEVLPPRGSISPCSKAPPKNVSQSPLPAVPSNTPSLSLGKTKGPKALGVWRKHPFLGEWGQLAGSTGRN